MVKITRPGLLIKRRGNFQETPPDAIPTQPVTGPQHAWVIVSPSWHHNDEFNAPEGGPELEPHIFYNEADGHARCKVLNDNFYAECPTPAIFEINFENYFSENWPTNPDGTDKDEAEITWDEAREIGDWEDPYQLIQLHTLRDVSNPNAL